MENLANISLGTTVSLASSSDDQHPAESVIDGNPNTFWLTTGMFPQELVITFRSLVAMDSIMVKSTNIRRIRVERSELAEPSEFEALTEKNLDSKENEVQLEEFKLERTTARHMKLVISQAYGHTISVHGVSVNGSIVR